MPENVTPDFTTDAREILHYIRIAGDEDAIDLIKSKLSIVYCAGAIKVIEQAKELAAHA